MDKLPNSFFVFTDDLEKFSLKHDEVGRPLYFDAQATTPMVSTNLLICKSYLKINYCDLWEQNNELQN